MHADDTPQPTEKEERSNDTQEKPEKEKEKTTESKQKEKQEKNEKPSTDDVEKESEPQEQDDEKELIPKDDATPEHTTDTNDGETTPPKNISTQQENEHHNLPEPVPAQNTETATDDTDEKLTPQENGSTIQESPIEQTQNHENEKQEKNTELIPLPQQTPEPVPVKKDVGVEKEKKARGKNPKNTSVRINEVLANPEGADGGKEFIELYNDSNTDISLEKWQLYDKTQKKYTFGDVVIKKHDYIVLWNKKDFTFTLNNHNEEIILDNTTGDTIAQYAYAKATSGVSWNYDADEWYEADPTPDEKNAPNPLTQDYPHIMINELYPHPQENESANEFIELYNPSDDSVSLKNWVLRDGSQTGAFTFGDVAIPAHGYYTVYRSAFSFALNNTGDTVSLIAPNTKVIATHTYTHTFTGQSLNYATKTWYWAEPTPHAKNADNPLTKEYPTLLLSEVLPNPMGADKTDEFIEIYNPHDFAVDLKHWILRDATTARYVFPSSHPIAPHAYAVIYRTDFRFALNNGTDTVSLIAPNTKTMSTCTWHKSKKGVSYNYHPHTHVWRHSKHITPGKTNVFNHLPRITKLDIDDAYKNTFATFRVKATDADGEKLKVRWDFGDGHRSYLWKTRHKYTKKGTYHVSVRISDGSEDVTKEMTVRVKKYPRHDVEIITVAPNPHGKDRGAEYIVLKNNENKTIDLARWSIATGTTAKKLANHPLKKDIDMKKHETKTITHKHAAISLPNKKGIIEIRRPDGSVADTVVYGDEHTSIASGAVYNKTGTTWTWTIPPKTKKYVNTRTIIAQARRNEERFERARRESDFAFARIHNPKPQTENRFVASFTPLKNVVLRCNALINHFITRAQEHIHHYDKTETRLAVHTPARFYVIPPNTDPCAVSYVPQHTTFDFCTIPVKNEK